MTSTHEQGGPAARARPEVPVADALADRWRAGAHPVVLTGVQAIPRLLIEQRARDRAAGLRTAAFVSGYQGSPLAGLDLTLAGIPGLLADHDVHHVPGLNEELAATAVWGSQLALPGRPMTRDGVVGLWYGKAPGLDRAGDAIRHANTLGVHPRGGVLALVGDDPACKSSTLPSASGRTLAALDLPVLSPRDAADVIRLGQYGVALSRASGCWVGMTVTADVADGLWSIEEDPVAGPLVVPDLEWDGRPWRYEQHTIPIPPGSVRAEAQLLGPRAAMVGAFAAANPADVVLADPADAWLGILAVGPATGTCEQALAGLGLDRAALDRAGIRLTAVTMPHPLSPTTVRRIARGVDAVLVVEAKAGFVEAQVRDRLYGTAGAPRVLGKHDHDGAPLLPVGGDLTVGAVADALRRVLEPRVPLQPRPPVRQQLAVLPGAARTPYFCSGCPHNRSTTVPDGSLAGGGIGCHAMVALIPREESAVVAMTQMGGEGAQWIGQAPFTDVPHLFQNLGDGTFAHSGQLAVQACVAAGVDITFKLLHNSAVAMTGGQAAAGARTVPEITRKLHAEGVTRTIVCTDEPGGYGRRAAFAPGVEVWHRDRLDEAQRVLRDTPGVTVLLYDQQCAAEARRLRKRGLQPTPRTRVVINEAVCEGCGDCGRKSSCLSVQPVETEFGRKTRIDQTSCNLDLSCLDGDCPSFVTVEVPEEPAVRGARGGVRTGRSARSPRSSGSSRPARPEPPAVPDPAPAPAVGTIGVVLAGIGGTGIVTANQVLAAAARIDGLVVRGLDQTGLSQKAGPVTSHLRIGAADDHAGHLVGPGAAACYLAFDVLVGADGRHLAATDPQRTVGVLSTSRTPTGAVVRGAADLTTADVEALVDRIRGACRTTVALDAVGATTALFGTAVTANILLVGAAYQTGVLPVTASAVEAAIRMNGVAVEANVAAFRWGRAAVADPDAFAAATAPPTAAPAPPRRDLGGSPLAGAVRDAVERRAADLVRYQGEALAAGYVAVVERVWRRERDVTDETALSLAVARGLHRLMAYKDEYEVAALLADPAFRARVAAEVPDGSRLRYRLHPPALRAMGLRRKVALGAGWTPVLRLLAHGRRVRGTAVDPFGRAAVRRLERALVAEHRALVEAQLAALDGGTYPTAVAVAEAAQLVRGYEHVKVAAVRAYHERLRELGVPAEATATSRAIADEIGGGHP